MNNPRIIFWKTAGERTFNLRENDSVKTTLARIHPKADKQTPDSKMVLDCHNICLLEGVYHI